MQGRGILSSLAILGGAAVLLYGIYNVLFHPLRNYPGPLLWRAFRLPWVFAIHSGRIHQRMKELHDRYGPVVRIAPNELSYTDSQAWKDINVSRPGHLPFERNRIWFELPIRQPDAINSPDEEIHAKMKRTFAPGFQEKSLKLQIPIVESYVGLFMEQMRSMAETTVDLEYWFNLLAFDISGDLSFGESFNCVKSGKLHPWMENAMHWGEGIYLLASVNFYWPLNHLLRKFLPNKTLRAYLEHVQFSADVAKKRLESGIDRPDWIGLAKPVSDSKTKLTMDEWGLNASFLVIGGGETVSTALTATVRTLVQNPRPMKVLVNEIRGAFEDESQITIASTGRLEYLTAVINEAMRVCPPVVIGFPRLVPKGGDTVCGQWVSEGTLVAVNQYPTYRSSRNFQDPHSFTPERFLSSNQDGRDDLAAFQPFNIGRHSCVGVKFAYAELRLVLARLFYTFDVSLADGNDRWDWGDQDSHIFWEKRPLRVKLALVNL